ncbi:leucyl aminopeptidase [Kribbella orskensis]|uniref:Probable cytosol aminopeptidase n=1 Tax=Kribbella orskensis TaxID=2512216 RepID=A0ABY2BBZ5_9ACTN|nr:MULTISPECIES: leucyl aminopeptidase family protein [Kribbella]TCN34822.1 leucyl aminopeptidase [Kribbella sp. VKM Ac-2500]TCO15527.1 leucyl aminopeptidase [Kribbella orskensis]
MARRTAARNVFPTLPALTWQPGLPVHGSHTWVIVVGEAGLPAAAKEAGKRLGVDLDRLLEVQQSTGFSPTAGATAAYPLLAGEVAEVLLVGAGDGSPADLRHAGAAIARFGRGKDELTTVVAEGIEDGALQAFAEGVALGSFTFHRKTVDPGKPAVERVSLTDGTSNDRTAVLDRGLVIGRTGWLARELATTPSNEKDPAWLAARATELAGVTGLDVRVWDEKQLAADGFGGILAVGQGSTRPPRFIRLDYVPEGANKNTPYIVLVGKGITYDTGGLSLKPRESMVSMKRDMTGGGSVIATMSALRELGAKIKVTGLICSAENMPSGTAYRPDDVIRHYGGRTTEVKNTDAEGRLVLADGLAYAVNELKPDALVDIATLTGAIKVSLGSMLYGGLFATDDALADNLAGAGDAAGERLWRMPLPDVYTDLISTPIADSVNSSKGPGSITAALFLKAFSGGLPWAHLDLSSIAESQRDEYEYSLGATGAGARLLTTWLTTDNPTAGIS